MPLRFHPDGLWHCLCPSQSFLVGFQAPLRLRQSCVSGRTQRCINSLTINSPLLNAPAPPPEEELPPILRNGLLDPRIPGFLPTSQRVSKSNIKLEEEIQSEPTPQLYKLLASLQELLVARNVRPESRHYKALLLANANANFGSALGVRRLLEEMYREAVGVDGGVLHAVMKALASHPDYLLRSEVLVSLQKHWFELSVDGWHDLIVGLLRERQIELAIEKLETMRERKLEVAEWLYSLVLYTLCELKEFDEVVRIIRDMLNGGVAVRPTVWYYMLDTASQVYHHEATRMAWNRRIDPGYLNPPTGLCHNVLITAARAGDPALATSVFQHLSKRRTKVTMLDYEALVECYVNANDIKTALEVLCIMRKMGHEPTDGSTRPLQLYFQPTKGLSTYPINAAFEALKDLKTQGRDIPIAAVNLLIENLDAPNSLGVYKSIPSLCSAGPSLATFNKLFRVYRKYLMTDRAMVIFLVTEMKALGIEPDALTYDRILLCCVRRGLWKEALLFFKEMRARDLVPRRASTQGYFEQAKSFVEKRGAAKSSEALELMRKIDDMRVEMETGGESAFADERVERAGEVDGPELIESESPDGVNEDGPEKKVGWDMEAGKAMSEEIKELLRQEYDERVTAKQAKNDIKRKAKTTN